MGLTRQTEASKSMTSDSRIWSSGRDLIGESGANQHANVLKQKLVHSTELKHRKVLNVTR